MIPIVLHHGLFGHGDLEIGPVKISSFPRIDRAITDAGHPLIVTRVHPTSTIQNRAIELKEQIVHRMQALGRTGQRVILMAHSMGGLDARYAVTKLGMDRYVAAVVTISTPHRGSPFADWVVENLGRRLRGVQLARLLRLDLRAGLDLTTRRCAAFNQSVPDMPDVKYFSVSAARPRRMIPPFALYAHHVVHTAEGENDGLVSIKSAAWGDHRGTWDADHWETINRRWWPRILDKTVNIAPSWMNLLTDVKAAIA